MNQSPEQEQSTLPLKVFDDRIFEVNSGINVTTYDVGNHKNRIVSVDNFFAYPEKVRDFLLTIPQQFIPHPSMKPTAWDAKAGFYPGYQTYLSFQIKELEEKIKKIAQIEFGYSGRFINYSFQRIFGHSKVFKQSNWPHCDDSALAGNICLNFDDEIEGDTGTSFYRVKETGEEYFHPSTCMYRKSRYCFTPQRMDMDVYQPIVENTKYIRYHLDEHKFNRFNLYEGACFHTAFMEKGKYLNTPRMTLSISY